MTDYVLNSEIKRIAEEFADVMSEKYDRVAGKCGLNYCTSDSIQDLLKLIGITDDRPEDDDNDT